MLSEDGVESQAVAAGGFRLFGRGGWH